MTTGYSICTPYFRNISSWVIFSGTPVGMRTLRPQRIKISHQSLRLSPVNGDDAPANAAFLRVAWKSNKNENSHFVVIFLKNL